MNEKRNKKNKKKRKRMNEKREKKKKRKKRKKNEKREKKKKRKKRKKNEKREKKKEKVQLEQQEKILKITREKMSHLISMKDKFVYAYCDKDNEWYQARIIGIDPSRIDDKPVQIHFHKCTSECDKFVTFDDIKRYE